MVAPQLIRRTVPVLRCTAICPTCGNPVDDYPLFESGPGGDIDTWQNTENGSLYAIDLFMVAYGQTTMEACLEPVVAHAGGRDKLRHLPEEVYCKFCSKTFHAESGHIQREERTEAFLCEMPQRRRLGLVGLLVAVAVAGALLALLLASR